MKSQIRFILPFAGLFAVFHVGLGQYVSDDDYWGGVPTSAAFDKDIVGSEDPFDITQGEVIVNGSDVTVNIYGNYFDDILAGDDSALWFTSMGDLFMSTDGLSWNNGGAATLSDYFGSGSETSWEYGVQLGQYLNNDPNDLTTQQTGEVLTVDEITLSDPGPFTNFRENQEVLVARGQDVGDATWFIDANGGGDNAAFLSITISDFFNTLGVDSVFDVGFHWTMSCGNDVIEFQPVPEPATVGLLGCAGLLGVLFIRRRMTRR